MRMKWMMIAAVLVPFTAAAQVGGFGGYGARGGRAVGVYQIGTGPGTFAAGTINGTVEGVAVGRGVLTIRTGNGIVRVNAVPGQIAMLNPGDVVSLRYANFNGVLWVALAPGPSGEAVVAHVPFTNEGRITGAIDALGRAAGTIVVRGVTFRIHPQQVQGLLPGQFVSLLFAQVGNINWVVAVRPAIGAPPAIVSVPPPPPTGVRSFGRAGIGGLGAFGGYGTGAGYGAP